MRLIDADKFLGYLIFSKHIDSLKCKEVKEAVEMCKVDVLEQIRDEIESHILDTNGLEFNSALYIASEIINNYIKERGI